MSAPKWRMAAGVLVLLVLLLFGVELIPVYYHAFQFQRFVSATTKSVENQTKSDDLLRDWVLDKAASLNLPVKADDVRIKRWPEGMQIEVRYAVRVDLPGYTVNLHFFPGARK